MHRIVRRTVQAIILALAPWSGATAQNFVHHRGFTSSPELGSKYGWSMAISAEHVVFGMPHALGQQGRLAVYPASGLAWTSDASVVYIDEGASQVPAQRYGASVATSGDLIVVGNCSAYGSDQYCNDAAGSIAVLQRAGPSWQVVQHIERPGGATGKFGSALAMDQEWLAVGGCEIMVDGVVRRVVYIYVWSGASFGTAPVDSLVSTDALGDDFGSALAMHGDLLAVGASRDADLGVAAGAAYLFQYGQGGGGNWGVVRKFLASDGWAGDRFGFAVALRHDRLVVGAPGRGQEGVVAGGAYVFARDTDSGWAWGEVAALRPRVIHVNMQFGASVAQSDVHVAVGAPIDPVSSFGTDGSVELFAEDSEGNWPSVQHIVPLYDQHVSEVSRAGTALGFIDGALLIGAPFAIMEGLTNTPTGGVLLYRDPLLSVNEARDQLSVGTWPNPFNEVLNVDVGAQGRILAELFDPLGRSVRSEQVFTAPFTMLRGGLRPGPYTLRLTDDQGYVIATVPVLAQ